MSSQIFTGDSPVKTVLSLVYRGLGQHEHDHDGHAHAHAPQGDHPQNDNDHDDHAYAPHDQPDGQDNCQVPLNIVIVLSFFYGIICLMALVSSP